MPSDMFVALSSRRSMNRRVNIWLTVVLGIGAVLPVSGLVLRATIEVLHHRGAEIYVNAKGMQVHWVDVLTGTASLLLALLVLLVATACFNWRSRRDAPLVKTDETNSAASDLDK
jgi:hypothetical protein